MANERTFNDPNRLVDDPHRPPPDAYRANPDDYLATDEDVHRQARLENGLEPDPELAEDTTSGGKIAMFAIAVALVLGAVFYGMNNSSINQAGTASTAQNTTQTSPPAAPPGMRDVTPRANNTEPGTTTGAAPARPAQPTPAPATPDAPK
jgi:hypothetical protein